MWECALAAGRALIDHAGAVHFAAFQPVLERAVERPPVVESAEIGDRVSGMRARFITFILFLK